MDRDEDVTVRRVGEISTVGQGDRLVFRSGQGRFEAVGSQQSGQPLGQIERDRLLLDSAGAAGARVLAPVPWVDHDVLDGEGEHRAVERRRGPGVERGRRLGTPPRRRRRRRDLDDRALRRGRSAPAESQARQHESETHGAAQRRDPHESATDPAPPPPPRHGGSRGAEHGRVVLLDRLLEESTAHCPGAGHSRLICSRISSLRSRLIRSRNASRELPHAQSSRPGEAPGVC